LRNYPSKIKKENDSPNSSLWTLKGPSIAQILTRLAVKVISGKIQDLIFSYFLIDFLNESRIKCIRLTWKEILIFSKWVEIKSFVGGGILSENLIEINHLFSIKNPNFRIKKNSVEITYLTAQISFEMNHLIRIKIELFREYLVRKYKNYLSINPLIFLIAVESWI